MLYLKLLSIIASIFSIYPLWKFIRKEEINIFDLIILFHTIFFCLVPLGSDYSAFLWLDGFYFEHEIISRIFIYYVMFIGFLLGVDIFWTKYFKYKKSILNITYYLKTLPQIDISWVFICFLLVNLIISWLWFLPQASYMDTFNKYTKLQGFETSPMFLLYNSIFTMCFSFTLILFLKDELSFKKRNMLIIILTGFSLLLLFLPRREMLFYVMLGLIVVYSLKRNFFTIKRGLWICAVLFIIVEFYFPFYNVMRRSTTQIDHSNYINSLISLVENSRNHFSDKKKTDNSEGRALNLYYALYRIVKYDKSPENGKLFLAAIDHALPKVLNPNKGEGTEPILLKKMRCNKDQADSVLLLAYGDFGLFLGFFYSLLLYLLIIYIYVLLYKWSRFYLNNCSAVGILLIVFLISMSWNVERKLDVFFSSYIHLIIISIILLFLSKFRIIGHR